MPDWVTEKHPNHRPIRREGEEDTLSRDEYVWDLYSGHAVVEARDRAQRIAREEGLELSDKGEIGRFQPKRRNRRPDLGKYLFRRAQGENPEAFSERARISKFPPHFAQIVDRHVGAVQLAGYKTRQWADPESGDGPLGDPKEKGTTAERLKSNADGRGTSWESLMTQAIKRCFLMRRMWYLVDGPTERSPMPRVRLLDSEAVTNWMHNQGRLTDVVVMEEVDARDSIQDEHGTETRYIHYNLDGYRRFDEDGDPIVDEAIQPGGKRQEWENPFYETSGQERRILPIGYVDLNLGRDVAENIAEDQEYVYNLLSDIRMMLRLLAHPKLHLNADDQEYEATVNALLSGANLVRGESAQWMVPDYAEVKSAYEQYRKEVQEMYDTAFQQLNDSAAEKTATETRMKDQRGRQAFLTHLSDRAEEIERSWLWRLAQIEAPASPDQWDVIEIERSRDYAPVNPNAEATALKELYFPNQAVPASRQAKKEAALEIAKLQGVPEEDDDGLEAAITIGSGRPSDQRIAQLQETVANATTNGEA